MKTSLIQTKRKADLEQGKITAINKLTGRVSLFMKNGLISAATYLHDINDLRVGMNVLVTRMDNSYIVINKTSNMPRSSMSVSLPKPIVSLEGFVTDHFSTSVLGDHWYVTPTDFTINKFVKNSLGLNCVEGKNSMLSLTSPQPSFSYSGYSEYKTWQVFQRSAINHNFKVIMEGYPLCYVSGTYPYLSVGIMAPELNIVMSSEFGGGMYNGFYGQSNIGVNVHWIRGYTEEDVYSAANYLFSSYPFTNNPDVPRDITSYSVRSNIIITCGINYPDYTVGVSGIDARNTGYSMKWKYLSEANQQLFFQYYGVLATHIGYYEASGTQSDGSGDYYPYQEEMVILPGERKYFAEKYYIELERSGFDISYKMTYRDWVYSGIFTFSLPSSAMTEVEPHSSPVELWCGPSLNDPMSSIDKISFTINDLDSPIIPVGCCFWLNTNGLDGATSWNEVMQNAVPYLVTDCVIENNTLKLSTGSSMLEYHDIIYIQNDFTIQQEIMYTGVVTGGWIQGLVVLGGASSSGVMMSMSVAGMYSQVKDYLGNDICNERIGDNLSSNSWHKVKINVTGRVISMYIDDVLIKQYTASIDAPLQDVSMYQMNHCVSGNVFVKNIQIINGGY